MPRTSPPRKDKNKVPRQKRELPAAAPKEAERIAKVIARAGLASRREIEDWIAEGRVAVNGTVLQSPAVTVTARDVITVDGAPLPERERTRLFLYHKPRGVVTTNRDPEGRTTLFEILPKGLPRLVSVGRLDLNSEGLLLLTNDGGLARVLELPETGWLRRYRVRAYGEIDQARLDTLIKGITVDGVDYGPIEAELDRLQGTNAWITVSLREGKNREVRNVLGALGLKVNRLIRISYGPFQLGEITEGAIEEVRTRVLRDQIGDELAAAAGADFEGPLVERELEAAPPLPPRPALPAHRSEAPPVQDEFRPAGPRQRRRIAEVGEVETRGTVADRKGRTVQVERLTPRPGAAERPARVGSRSTAGKMGAGKMGAGRMGAGRMGAGKPGTGRWADRDEAGPPARGGRFARQDRHQEHSGFSGGEDRPRRPRGEGGPQRFGANRAGRSFGPREEGEPSSTGYQDRPWRGSAAGSRPRSGDMERPEGRPSRSTGGFGRPRSSAERSEGTGYRDRPAGEKRFSRRPDDGFGASEGERPRGKGGFGRPRSSAERSEGTGYRDRPAGEKRFSRRPDDGFGAGQGDRPRGRNMRSAESGSRSLSESPFAGDRPARKGPPKGFSKPYAKGPARSGPGAGGRTAGGPKSGPKGSRPGGKGPAKGPGGRPGGPRGKR